MASKTWSQIWVRPEVYPIWAAVGGALCITTFFVTRQISTSPGFRPFKEGRMEGVHEGKARVKEGTQWREHSIRKFMRTQKPQIFPGLNAAMTKAS